ncbi:MAG: cohesin domain-containing protein [Bacteroidota bacterium]|nr:cohesin domain-containing protein [Bacteroidota bacterium]
MKKYILTLTIILSFIQFSSCKKDPVTPPPPPPPEDFTFPADTSFSVRLISSSTAVSSGGNFDVKLVFYNMQNVFGSAVEILYDKNLVEIPDQTKMLVGPYFQTGDTSKIMMLKKVEQGFGRASLGISYIKNSGLVSGGSGVVIKLKAKAIAAGNAWFKINKNKLEIKKSDGNYINNFSILKIDSLQVTIQ